MAEALITQKGWQPYIRSTGIDLAAGKAYHIITFKGHEQLEHKSSISKTASLLKLARPVSP